MTLPWRPSTISWLRNLLAGAPLLPQSPQPSMLSVLVFQVAMKAYPYHTNLFNKLKSDLAGGPPAPDECLNEGLNKWLIALGGIVTTLNGSMNGVTSTVFMESKLPLPWRPRPLPRRITKWRKIVPRKSVIPFSHHSVCIATGASYPMPLAIRCTARHRLQIQIFGLNRKTKSRCHPRCEDSRFTTAWRCLR
ncbi:hypothetical protein BJY52DRAFT_152152 [Lactarius psammicola]|nr:hypothetical protein BJY52DRAFT_152152 [Lactarius psammicola]